MQNSTSKSLATQQSITVQFSPSIKQIMPKKVFSVSDPTAKAITLSAVEMNVRQLGEWQVFKWHSCVVTTWCGNNSAQWYPIKWSLSVWQQLSTMISRQVISLTLSLTLSFHMIHTHSLWSALCIHDSLAVRSPGNSGVSLLMPWQLETWNLLKDVIIYSHQLQQILIQALDFKSLLQCFHFFVPQQQHQFPFHHQTNWPKCCSRSLACHFRLLQTSSVTDGRSILLLWKEKNLKQKWLLAI